MSVGPNNRNIGRQISKSKTLKHINIIVFRQSKATSSKIGQLVIFLGVFTLLPPDCRISVDLEAAEHPP